MLTIVDGSQITDKYSIFHKLQDGSPIRLCNWGKSEVEIVDMKTYSIIRKKQWNKSKEDDEYIFSYKVRETPDAIRKEYEKPSFFDLRR